MQIPFFLLFISLPLSGFIWKLFSLPRLYNTCRRNAVFPPLLDLQLLPKQQCSETPVCDSSDNSYCPGCLVSSNIVLYSCWEPQQSLCQLQGNLSTSLLVQMIICILNKAFGRLDIQHNSNFCHSLCAPVVLDNLVLTSVHFCFSAEVMQH